MSDALIAAITAHLEGVNGADDSLLEVADLRSFVAAMGAPTGRIHFAPRLARGMDYYTGPIFEATLDDLSVHFGSQVAGYRRYAAAAIPAGAPPVPPPITTTS